MCVNLTRAPSPVARPGGTHGESREAGERASDVEGGLEMDQGTEKCSGREMDEYIDTGRMKQCETRREKVKQRRGNVFE